MDDETGTGAANRRIVGDGIDSFVNRAGEYQSVRVGRPQELDAQDVGDDKSKDERSEHDTLLVHVTLAEAYMAYIGEVDLFLLEDGSGKLEAVPNGNLMALAHIDGLTVLLADGNMLGNELLCYLAERLRNVNNL